MGLGDLCVKLTGTLFTVYGPVMVTLHGLVAVQLHGATGVQETRPWVPLIPSPRLGHPKPRDDQTIQRKVAR